MCVEKRTHSSPMQGAAFFGNLPDRSIAASLREMSELERAGASKLTFSIVGAPVPWARARVSRAARHFTPPKQRHYMTVLRSIMQQAVSESNWLKSKTLPLRVEILCVFERPKSNKTVAHVQKPDASNLAKIVEDAGNGIAWHDDAQITALTVRKAWGMPARVDVVVTRE